MKIYSGIGVSKPKRGMRIPGATPEDYRRLELNVREHEDLVEEVTQELVKRRAAREKQ